MVARSIDAEFLRYLAGTHHISEAFARAGLQEGQDHGWVICLPSAHGLENDLGHLQPEADDVRQDFDSIIAHILMADDQSSSHR